MKDSQLRRFDGRVAIVTGAARGIGREYAEQLAREGANVCVADIKGDLAEKTAAEINKLGGRAIAVSTDVSDEEQVVDMVASTVAEFGGVDYLVNNAALYGDRVPWDPMTGDVAYWNKSIAVNMTSVLLCTRAVVSHMAERGGGAIVNQSSSAAWVGGALQYQVTKMGVISLTIGLARLLGPKAIRVNAVAPGLTDTQAYRQQVVETGHESQLIAQLPLAKRGTPADQAAGVLYLLSDDANYVTGQVLAINGGMTMRG